LAIRRGFWLTLLPCLLSPLSLGLSKSGAPILCSLNLGRSVFAKSLLFNRFYAGAPLRTSDGFNIGSLCIIDDHPRSEFTPRQRHTLKEFAVRDIKKNNQGKHAYNRAIYAGNRDARNGALERQGTWPSHNH